MFSSDSHDHFEMSDVADLISSREFLGGGPTTKKLEAALATKLDVLHVVTCANGTDALQLALRACGIGPGSRVAIPNLTFWATYEAVVNVGATPVLIDINPDDRQMSFEDFKRAHEAKMFDAAILVHLYGWCSSQLMDFRWFCSQRHIPLIEDGAQAFGVTVSDRSVFHGASIATLSFHPAKVLGGIGDGGAVLTSSRELALRVRALANHGRAGGQHEHIAAGWNSRLDAIQAAWLLRALDVIDEVIEERLRLKHLYATLLTSSVHVQASVQQTPSSGKSNGYMTTFVRTGQKPAAEIIKSLAEQCIEARRIYPHTIADLASGFGGKKGAVEFGPLPHSRALAEHVISLPLYYGMSDETVERCVSAYVKAVK